MIVILQYTQISHKGKYLLLNTEVNNKYSFAYNKNSKQLI